MKIGCDEKVCKRCGWCCQSLGKEIDLSLEEDKKLKRVIFEQSGVIYLRSLRKFFLALKKEEKDKLDKKAKELGITLDIMPNKLIYDKVKDKVFVFDYYINCDSCPFYNDTGCMIYEDRPVACQDYPMKSHSYSDEVKEFVKKNNISFEDTTFGEALKKCEEFVEKLNATTGI